VGGGWGRERYFRASSKVKFPYYKMKINLYNLFRFFYLHIKENLWILGISICVVDVPGIFIPVSGGNLRTHNMATCQQPRCFQVAYF
jgi:hypothetical protein